MRLGLHANTNGHTDKLVEYCRRVQPNAVKLLDPNREVVIKIKSVSPGTAIIGRKHWDPQRLDNYGDFKGAAVALAIESGVDWMEGYNEWSAERDLSSFAGAEVSLAKELNRHGIGALIGGFSTGWLDSTDERGWRKFKPAFDYMRQVGPGKCGLHFHEYSGAYMQYGVQTPDGKNQWTGRDERGQGGSWNGVSEDPALYWNPTLKGYWTLRYRDLRLRLVANGYADVAFWITESGIDDVNPRPGGANRKGWRDFHGTEWSRLPGIGDITAQWYWYLWQISHDRYVKGVVDFGWATADPAWGSFDYSQTPTELEALMVSQAKLPTSGVPTVVAPAQPTPTEPPVIDPVANVMRVEARGQVLKGEGWTGVARRFLGREPRRADVEALRRSNPTVNGLTPGQWLRSPWHDVVKREG